MNCLFYDSWIETKCFEPSPEKITNKTWLKAKNFECPNTITVNLTLVCGNHS